MEDQMSDTSRRGFIAAGGVGVGAVAAVGAGAFTASASARPSADRARERVVAIVDDHNGDTVTLLVGEREVVVKDRDLVTRLLNAAGSR
jgi:Rieske Fe-S protein